MDQYYLRAENHGAANAVLIDAQAQIPIAQVWGGGLLASVDGLRFVVPVRTINAGPAPKYFGYKRGITWLNAVSDQVAGIGQMVVPGTPRDSLYILDMSRENRSQSCSPPRAAGKLRSGNPHAPASKA